MRVHSDIYPTASETLALLFQFPREYIAGVKTPVPKEIKYDLEFEYGETVEALKILTSRPLWKERILAVFKRLDDETFPDVQRYFEQAFVRPRGGS